MVERLEARLDVFMEELEDIRDFLETAIEYIENSRDVETATQGVREVSATLGAKDRSARRSSTAAVVPIFCKFKTVDDFVSFDTERDNAQYQHLVNFLARRSGTDATTALNSMIFGTMENKVVKELIWLKNVKGTFYADACRAAIDKKIINGNFRDERAERVPINDHNFGAAFQAGLKSVRARWARDKKRGI